MDDPTERKVSPLRPEIDVVPVPAAAPIEILVAEFSPAMFRVAQSIVGDRSLAEDIVQEALVRVWLHLDDYRGDAPLKNWALRITHNCAISYLRKRRDESRDPETLSALPSEHTGADVARTVVARSAMHDVWAALDQLDPVTRSIVILREVEHLSYDEIADILELALPTVKTRLFRARRTLSVQLEEWK